MFSDDELIALSAIQHYVFCPRRAALVFIERQWGENVATREGARLHQKTERGSTDLINGVLITRSLSLRSLRWGLIGVADVVEFHPAAEEASPDEVISLPRRKGKWTVFPVEYKRGKLRNEDGYIQQLCGQTLCLEEMLDVRIPRGAIFFGKTRRRLDVAFTEQLRARTSATINQLHNLFLRQQTPRAKFEKKCRFCSLVELCSPQSMKSPATLQRYINSAFELGDELT